MHTSKQRPYAPAHRQAQFADVPFDYALMSNKEEAVLQG